ncbi:MAG: transporter substrate-binding domain-containing protein [Syntrophaceae bacterium]|nr:transporter substrate-binding domain-containing protein [Syntrophaceae bacterium]
MGLYVEAEAQPSVCLTAEEHLWLDRNRDKITLLFNTEFPPIEFISPSGAFVGMGADVIDMIEQRLGVKFHKQPCDDWNRHLAALKSGECAIAPTIVGTPEREQYAFFTTPYATVPIVIITPRALLGTLTLTDLKGRRVGVVSGYATEKYLRNQAIPGLKIITIRSVTEGLHNVSFGQLDAFVENLAVAAYFIEQEGIPNLRVAGKTDYSFAWSIGVSRKYPLLYTSIQKAVEAIPAEEIEHVRKQWVSLEYNEGLNPETIWKLKVAAFFAATLLLSLTVITIFLKRRLNQKVASLGQSEQRYRDLVQNARAIILEWNTLGIITFFNEYAQKSFGYTEEEVLGRNVVGTIVPETDTWGKDLVAMIDAICRDPDAFHDNENENITKDGRRVWIRWSNRAIYKKEKLIGILSIGSDITEQKQSEMINASRLHLLQFAATHSLNELLEETLNEAETMTNSLVGFYHLINDDQRTIRQKGWSTRTRAVLCKAEVKDGHYPLDQAGVWAECAQQRKPVIHNEYASLPNSKGMPEGHVPVIRELVVPVFRNDRIRAVLGIGNKITDYDERDIGVISRLADLAWDIAEHKRVVEEHRQLEERFQRAEKMEALGLLSGGVAHDLNNVLGIIIGYSELLLLKLDESDPLQPYAKQIMNASERAGATIQDMLTLARRGVQARKVVNVNNLVIDFLKTPEFENIIKMHQRIQVKTHLEAELLHIMGSAHQLCKTISNLVSNAFEAMPNGGILTMTTANRYLDSPIQGYDEVLEGDYVVLSVSDSGTGISDQDIKHIFEPFYTKKVMGRSGTGLGLAVVWGTVKDHNGYIDVQSEEGKGSTFTLYLPVTREEIETEAQAVSLHEYMGHGETVLVVDDVEGQRNMAAEMLTRLHYNVAVAASGEEAVTYIKKHPVDIMVLDMIMDPGMDGLDTYRRTLEIHPHQKVVIVSGFSDTERVRTAQSLGAGPYVKKPYVLEKLGLAVRKELDRKADSRAS